MPEESSPPLRDKGQQQIPLLLLKTRSTPIDAYQTYFSGPESGSGSGTGTGPLLGSPVFLPVLTHHYNSESMSHISSLLRTHALPDTYDGLIFTSQRAVEAFSACVHQVHADSGNIGNSNNSEATVREFPLYVVGPATGALLRPIVGPLGDLLGDGETQVRPAIRGQECGNGEALAGFLLDQYNGAGVSGVKQGKQRRRRLLFLVGEQRRDVIPRTLMDAHALAEHERVAVVELEVYRTDVRAEFERELRAEIGRLERHHPGGTAVVVVVVFSPQGCDTLLSVLQSPSLALRYVVVTIGPTTRDFLRRTYGFEPHACAKKPSPEGVAVAVAEFFQREEKVKTEAACI